MNKLLIIFLAICFIGICHAFVKRDAPESAKPDAVEEFKDKFKEFTEEFTKQVQNALDPDTIKKNFNNLVDNVNTQMSKFKTNGEAPKQ